MVGAEARGGGVWGRGPEGNDGGFGVFQKDPGMEEVFDVVFVMVLVSGGVDGRDGSTASSVGGGGVYSTSPVPVGGANRTCR